MKINKKSLIIIAIAVIIVIVAIIAIVVIMNSNNTEQDLEDEGSINVEQLEMQFDSMFDNEVNEYVISQASIYDEKAGSFYMEVNIPKLNIEGEVADKINNEINEVFIKKLIEVGDTSTIYTILKIDFCTNVNNNMLSLAIKCILKEGNNTQRTIIKTFCYDLEENREIAITEIVPETQREEIKAQIQQKLESQIKREKTIIEQGYNVYRRDIESDIYEIENTTEFYLSNENILYIIYCYGNNNYTSEKDLIITKVK